MANIQSAKKQARRSERARVRNRVHRTAARNAVRTARLEIEAGEVDSAIEATRAAISKLDRAATKGVIHRNNASRRKSRLMKHLAALEAQKDS